MGDKIRFISKSFIIKCLLYSINYMECTILQHVRLCVSHSLEMYPNDNMPYQMMASDSNALQSGTALMPVNIITY